MENSLRNDCQARAGIKRTQSPCSRGWTKALYRCGVWSSKKGHPLKKMQAPGMNMVDVKRNIKLRAVESKIEKRVLFVKLKLKNNCRSSNFYNTPPENLHQVFLLNIFL